jgi:hypothetical protein
MHLFFSFRKELQFISKKKSPFSEENAHSVVVKEKSFKKIKNNRENVDVYISKYNFQNSLEVTKILN